MRRMYSENQVIELVKKAFEEGKLEGGTKLYKHEISMTFDITTEGSVSYEIKFVIISNQAQAYTKSSVITNYAENSNIISISAIYDDISEYSLGVDIYMQNTDVNFPLHIYGEWYDDTFSQDPSFSAIVVNSADFENATFTDNVTPL